MSVSKEFFGNRKLYAATSTVLVPDIAVYIRRQRLKAMDQSKTLGAISQLSKEAIS